MVEQEKQQEQENKVQDNSSEYSDDGGDSVDEAEVERIF